jgi:uncharacterized repeat protein (TIGR01451 family)
VTVQPRTLQEALLQARRPAPKSGATSDIYASGAPQPPRAAAPGSSSRRAQPVATAATETESAMTETEMVEGDANEETTTASAEPQSLPVSQSAMTPPAMATEKKLLAQKLASLAVETSGPDRIAIGSEARYQVTLINSGDGVGRDVAMKIQLPEWAEVIDAEATLGDARLPAWNEASGSVTWSLREVAPRSRENLVLQIVPRKSQSFDMAIQLTQAPAVAQVHVEVAEPKLIMTLAGPREVEFGEKVIYKLTFSNPGNADAENIMVKLLPLGAGDGPADTHSIGTVAAGENKVVEMELVARQSGVLAIKAEATADGGLQSALNEDVLVRRAAIKIDVEGPAFQYARTVVNYSVKVNNPGNAASNNVEIVAQLPAKATYVSSSDAGQSEADGTRVVWKLSSLLPGEEKVLELKCQLENPGVNRVQVAAASGDMKDSASAATEVEALAELELDVIEPEGAFPVGEEVGYEVHIKNRGTKAAEGVDVQAFFSTGIEAINASGSRSDIGPGKVTFHTIPSIGAGKEVILKIRARADKSGNHVFRAEVFCKSLGTKLGEEGTTRFYGEATTAPTRQGATAETPTPADASSSVSPSSTFSTSGATSRRSRYETSSTSDNRYGSPAMTSNSRYGASPSGDRSGEPTPAADADVADDGKPLKPIPSEE